MAVVMMSSTVWPGGSGASEVTGERGALEKPLGPCPGGRVLWTQSIRMCQKSPRSSNSANSARPGGMRGVLAFSFCPPGGWNAWCSSSPALPACPLSPLPPPPRTQPFPSLCLLGFVRNMHSFFFFFKFISLF